MLRGAKNVLAEIAGSFPTRGFVEMAVGNLARKESFTAAIAQAAASPHSWLRIPGKANADPKASRTAFRDNPEHDSERSDAGLPIVL